MSISPAELAALHGVADGIRDEVEENGHRIDQAIGLHHAFAESDEIASSMLRALVVDGARAGARQNGVSPTRAHNGWDIVWAEEGLYRKYRIKKATKGRGEVPFDMLVGMNSALTHRTPELLGEEQWVLGYTVTSSRDIDEVFAARILGVTDHKVPHLILGQAVLLGSGSTPPKSTRFVSDGDEFLPGFGEGSGTEITGDAA